MDKYGGTYHNGKYVKDSHLFKSTFELDLENNGLVQTFVSDLKSDYKDDSRMEYVILAKPKSDLLWDSNQIKAIRYNPVTGSLSTIVFCKGSYICIDIRDAYANIWEGTYKYSD